MSVWPGAVKSKTPPGELGVSVTSTVASAEGGRIGSLWLPSFATPLAPFMLEGMVLPCVAVLLRAVGRIPATGTVPLRTLAGAGIGGIDEAVEGLPELPMVSNCVAVAGICHDGDSPG